jgi:hypothetical protein
MLSQVGGQLAIGNAGDFPCFQEAGFGGGDFYGGETGLQGPIEFLADIGFEVAQAVRLTDAGG